MTEDGYETQARRDAERRALIQKRLSEMQQHEPTTREFMGFADDDQCSKEFKLLAGVKERMPELTELLATMNARCEDGVYRFYHGSFKVYTLQSCTEHTIEIVLALAPNPALDSRFVEIMLAGTGKEFGAKGEESGPDAPGMSWRRSSTLAISLRCSASTAARRRAGRIAP